MIEATFFNEDGAGDDDALTAEFAHVVKRDEDGQVIADRIVDLTSDDPYESS